MNLLGVFPLGYDGYLICNSAVKKRILLYIEITIIVEKIFWAVSTLFVASYCHQLILSAKMLFTNENRELYDTFQKW